MQRNHYVVQIVIELSFTYVTIISCLIYHNTSQTIVKDMENHKNKD
jgi:hypothetical protein